MIYEFKVTPKDMPVAVWRTIQVHSDSTFKDLHRILQVVFDWQNSHLHSFNVRRSNGKKVEYIEIEPKLEEEEELNGFLGSFVERHDEKETKIADWFFQTKDKVLYTYDFGDNWEHNIELTKILPVDENIIYPRCIRAKNDTPDEDSRYEVIMGEVDLENSDSNGLVAQINELLQYHLADIVHQGGEETYSPWEEVLTASKKLLKLKPWQWITVDMIFAIKHPAIEEPLFCSVLGESEETFGLSVNIGKAGYESLGKMLTLESFDYFDLMVHQHSLLVRFVDREELDTKDYKLIKSHSIPFRGRKSWPQFVSSIPGQMPWYMSDEEAEVLLLALEQLFIVSDEIKAGIEVPDIFLDQKALTRVLASGDNELEFESKILDVADLFSEPIDGNPELLVSELELKRIEKIDMVVEGTLEFYMDYIDMPIQLEDEDRPHYPILTLVADRDDGIVVYHQMYTGELDDVMIQSNFVDFLVELEAIPETLIMDEQTVRIIKPLTDRLDVHVEIAQLHAVPYILSQIANLPFGE